MQLMTASRLQARTAHSDRTMCFGCAVRRRTSRAALFSSQVDSLVSLRCQSKTVVQLRRWSGQVTRLRAEQKRRTVRAETLMTERAWSLPWIVDLHGGLHGGKSDCDISKAP